METTKPKRRWLQFSLKSLLILVTVVAAFLGYQVMRVQKQERAIAAIEAIGGAVGYDEISPVWDWPRSIVGDKYFRKVVAVNLHRKNATDLHAECLASFPDLQTLVLNHTQVTDQGMRHLQGLTKLAWLELQYTKVGDEGIVYCKDLEKLATLRCSGTEISSSGVASIDKLSTTLMELWLERTKVTDEQAKDIKPRWPNTTIVYGKGNTL